MMSTPITTAAIALDYGKTISLDHVDPAFGQKPVDPGAAETLRVLYGRKKRLILASNTLPSESRWPALQAAGIDDVFTLALLSHSLGVGKPDPLFYHLVIAAADCPAQEILFVGDHLVNDVLEPMGHGMRAALVRQDGLRADEELPDGAVLIRHVRELPELLAEQ
ncbi:HAD family hydrolase [Actinomadura litoris]|nr:HAD family hydrolase [Actinomadura litoris]